MSGLNDATQTLSWLYIKHRTIVYGKSVGELSCKDHQSIHRLMAKTWQDLSVKWWWSDVSITNSAEGGSLHESPRLHTRLPPGTL